MSIEWLEVEPKERIINKFKSGDMVICKKEYKDFPFYFDTPKEIKGYSILGMALVGEISNFITDEYFELAKVNKFKVGDYIKSVWFDGVKKIKVIYGADNQHLTLENDLQIKACNCELVCGFTKGQMIEVSNNKYFNNPSKVLFNQFRPELEKPFECVTQEDKRKFENNRLYNANTWQFAKEIQPKYKAFTEPKLSWLNERARNNETDESFRIESISKHYLTYYINLIKKTDTRKLDMEDLFNNWTWEGGKPCGELIIKE